MQKQINQAVGRYCHPYVCQLRKTEAREGRDFTGLDAGTSKKFKSWIEKNCLDRDQVQKLDIEAEFAADLSFNEAVELALQKFPTLWKSELQEQRDNKPKPIIFVKDLIEKIIAGKVQVTYRKAPKVGIYYVINNRFKQNSDSSRLLIEFYQTDKVDPYKLTDDEARLAGVETAGKIRELFEKWYGAPIPLLYRNWFKVKEFSAS